MQLSPMRAHCLEAVHDDAGGREERRFELSACPAVRADGGDEGTRGNVVFREKAFFEGVQVTMMSLRSGQPPRGSLAA